MSKHSHISAIFDNAFQSRAGSPDVYVSMVETETSKAPTRAALLYVIYSVVNA